MWFTSLTHRKGVSVYICHLPWSCIAEASCTYMRGEQFFLCRPIQDAQRWIRPLITVLWEAHCFIPLNFHTRTHPWLRLAQSGTGALFSLGSEVPPHSLGHRVQTWTIQVQQRNTLVRTVYSLLRIYGGQSISFLLLMVSSRLTCFPVYLCCLSVFSRFETP